MTRQGVSLPGIILEEPQMVLLELLMVRKNSRMEVRPRQQMYTGELMESEKQTSRGLLFCILAGTATPAVEAWVEQEDTSMWQRYCRGSVRSQ